MHDYTLEKWKFSNVNTKWTEKKSFFFKFLRFTGTEIWILFSGSGSATNYFIFRSWIWIRRKLYGSATLPAWPPPPPPAAALGRPVLTAVQVHRQTLLLLHTILHLSEQHIHYNSRKISQRSNFYGTIFTAFLKNEKKEKEGRTNKIKKFNISI